MILFKCLKTNDAISCLTTNDHPYATMIMNGSKKWQHLSLQNVTSRTTKVIWPLHEITASKFCMWCFSKMDLLNHKKVKVVYPLQDIVINSNLCWMLVISRQIIGSVSCHYFLNRSMTEIPLQKIRRKQCFFFFETALNLLSWYIRIMKSKWLLPLGHAANQRKVEWGQLFKCPI